MTRYRRGLCGWLGSVVFPIHFHVDVVLVIILERAHGHQADIMYEYHYVTTELCRLTVVYKKHDYSWLACISGYKISV